MRPEQIDLTRTQADGVRDLKHFLEFAERGPKAIAEAVFGSIGDYESPFEQVVAEALSNKEWQVHPQIGVSFFRIDLGIIDPDAPGRYLAGLECDGATYHRSATARDRDKLREQVLRNLGWDILRIWSTDWWIDADGALEKIHTRLKSLLEKSRARREEEDRKRKEAANTSKITDSNEHVQEESENGKEGLEPVLPPIDPESNFHTSSTIDLYGTNEPEPPPKSTANGIFNLYRIYDGPSWRDPHMANTADVSEGLCQIIDIEGPMVSKRAFDTYLRGCGIKRMGHDLKDIMCKSLKYSIDRGRLIAKFEGSSEELLDVIVRNTAAPQIILRERGPRTLDEIPPSELLVASYIAIRDTGFKKGSDKHLRAILDLFDLKRLTTQTGTKLLEVLEMHFDYADAWLKEHNVEF